MPTNLYGPHDNFDLTSSHVLPALIRKFHDAKVEGRTEVTIWGTGTPRREFLHVDDLADACVFLMQHYEDALHINVGTGEELTIAELAEMVRGIVHPGATIMFDARSPTARRASCSTCHGCAPLGGGTGSHWARASKARSPYEQDEQQHDASGSKRAFPRKIAQSASERLPASATQGHG